MGFNMERYEELELLYGPDIDNWPSEFRMETRQFLASAAGQDYVKERLIVDRLWSDSGVILEQNEAAFLDKVNLIPVKHKQGQKATMLQVPSVWQLIWDVRFLLSPKGFVTQATAAAFIMLCGVLIGLQTTDNFIEGENEFDVSAEYFANYVNEEDWNEEGIL